MDEESFLEKVTSTGFLRRRNRKKGAKGTNRSLVCACCADRAIGEGHGVLNAGNRNLEFSPESVDREQLLTEGRGRGDTQRAWGL